MNGPKQAIGRRIQLTKRPRREQPVDATLTETWPPRLNLGL
jgi:hypothetical protein